MALDFLKKDASIQEVTEDILGGGSFTLDTGLYDFVIDSAYMDTSKGGAHNINFTFKNAEGKTHSETVYITSGTAKGVLNYYLDKDGNKQYLPGFSTANDISLCAAGVELSELEPEDKIVEVYNKELGKKAPTTKPVLMELLGKSIKLGVIKVMEFKNIKTDAGYVQGTETREFNEINKVFNAESGQTVVEAKAGKPGEFFTKWAERNTSDYVKDKTKGKSGSTATAGTPAAATKPTTSLFGAK